MSKRIAEMAKTLMEAAQPGITPKQLFESVRHRHPKASRKEIAQAAYFALINHAQKDVDRAQQMRGLAVAARPAIDDDD